MLWEKCEYFWFKNRKSSVFSRSRESFFVSICFTNSTIFSHVIFFNEIYRLESVLIRLWCHLTSICNSSGDLRLSVSRNDIVSMGKDPGLGLSLPLSFKPCSANNNWQKWHACINTLKANEDTRAQKHHCLFKGHWHWDPNKLINLTCIPLVHLRKARMCYGCNSIL